MQRFLKMFGVATVALALAGCTGGDGKYVPVIGKLQVGGQPAEGAQVTLVPTNASIIDPMSRPTGLVEADGSYKLSTYDPSRRKTYDGVPPGEYKVTIAWLPPLHVGEKADQKKRPIDKLGGRYIDPAKSPYPVVVKEPRTELDLIDLKDSKRN
ncbi:hypothetical protein [Zavarzinella formosa]|uniref:hypothetical protein n=1 Tax=Zavarzinella formosa TaxID=360055 RepID=UPI0002E0E882|nr:hypothetical protein [Zavarzinella formosa]